MTNTNNTWIARGAQKNQTYSTQIFNIDNGNGTTIDDVFYCVRDTVIDSIRPVYTEATDTTGAASANWKVGTAAGGTQIVGVTALQVAKAVGAAGTAGTLVATLIPAGSTIFFRHTGVASTEVGQYKLQMEYHVKP